MRRFAFVAAADNANIADAQLIGTEDRNNKPLTA